MLRDNSITFAISIAQVFFQLLFNFQNEVYRLLLPLQYRASNRDHISLRQKPELASIAAQHLVLAEHFLFYFCGMETCVQLLPFYKLQFVTN